MRHPTADDAVAAAINLAPQIRACRDELEATRQRPPPLVKALAAAGLFQLQLPRSLGGVELPPRTAFRAIAALSKLEGSVGWCAMIATAFSLFAGWLRADVGRALCGQPPDLRVAGSIRPQGQAYRERGRASRLLDTISRKRRGTGCPSALARTGGFRLSASRTRDTHSGSRLGIVPPAPSEAVRGVAGSRRGASYRGSASQTQPGKVGNQGPRDPLEGRRHRAAWLVEGTTGETLSSPTVATRLQRMAAPARQQPALPFPTRRDGAPGVDGVTAAADGANLEANLADVRARLRSGRSYAPPVKRT